MDVRTSTRGLQLLVVLLTLGLAVPPRGWTQQLDVTGGAAAATIAVPSTYQTVSVSDGGVLLVNAPLTVTGDMRVGPGGLVTMDAGVFVLSLTVGGRLSVELGGAIDTGGLGLPAKTTIDPVTGNPIPARSGSGSHCAPGAGATDDSVYDDALDPRLPGAGGGAVRGGGALIVSAGALHLDGILRVDGTSGTQAGGGNVDGSAGGTVNLTVGELSGGGRIRAVGGDRFNDTSSPGAGGCVRVAFDTTSFSGRFDVASGAVASERSSGSAVAVERGSGAVTVAAGVLQLRAGHRVRSLTVASGATLRLEGEAEVDEPLVVPAGATVRVASGAALGKLSLPLVRGTLLVDADTASSVPLVLTGRLVLNRRLSVPTFEARTGAVVTHDFGVRTMHLDVTGLLAVESGARVDAVGLGLEESRTIDPITGAEQVGSVGANGGSHGGLGGFADADHGGVVAPVFDDPLDPKFPGGGGGHSSNAGCCGGRGGGVLRLGAGLLRLDGALAADGAAGNHPTNAGGAGGSIVVRAGALEGSGTILARGHPVATQVSAAGGGGGGLVLLAVGASSFTGTVSAAGGPGRVAGQDGVVTELSVPVAPRIVSTPPSPATSGATYAYVPRATGTPPLSWTLASGPAGAAVDPSSGALVWTPTALGEASFELVVTNAHGEHRQAFRIGVVAPAGGVDTRGPPRFLSTPDTAARCGVPYRYSGEGAPVVAGAGPFTYSVEPALGLSPPSGLRVDPATGAFTWTPSPRDVGPNPIELRVVGAEGSNGQAFAVVVECDAGLRLGVGCGCASRGSSRGAAGSLVTLFFVGLLLNAQRPRQRCERRACQSG